MEDNYQERYYDEYEIDLREYIQVLWNGKWLIVGLFIAAVLIAGIVSTFYISPVYESEATIYAPSFNLINGEDINKNDYISIIHKPGIRERIIKKFDLNQKNQGYSIDNLSNKISVNTDSKSQLLKLKLKDSNPAITRDILNYWIKLFQDEVRSFINVNNNRYLDNLSENMQSQENTYFAALNDVTSFQKEVNLNLLKSQLAKKEHQLINVEEKITNLKTENIKNKAEYDRVLSQLKNTKEFITTEETISDESLKLLSELLPNVNQTISTETQNVNNIYINLNNKKINLEQKLDVNQEEIKTLKANQTELTNKINILQENIANYEQKQTKLNQKLGTANANYKSAENSYSQAKQLLSKKSYNLTVISEPYLPDSPVSPNKKLNVAIAGVLGIMLGVFIVFFKEFMKEEDEVEEKRTYKG